MRNLKLFLILLIVLCVKVVFGQDASPVPSPAAVPVASSIDQITLWIQQHLIASLGAIALIVEIVVRLVPTEKPRSILTAASSIMHSLAGLLDQAAKFLDGILQNLKQ